MSIELETILSQAKTLGGGTGASSRSLGDRVTDIVSVKDFGAKLDGTNDLAAFNKARAACGKNGQVRVQPGQFNVPGDITQGHADPIVWRLSGNAYGTSDVPVIQIGYDVVETVLSGGTLFYGKNTNKLNPSSTMRVDCNWAFHQPSGTSGTVAGFESNGTISAVRMPNFVWLNRNVLYSSAYGDGQHTALSGSVFRPYGCLEDGKGPRAPVWGAYSEATSQTGRPSNEDGVLHGMEINVGSNNLDPSNKRIMLLLSAGLGNTDPLKAVQSSQVGIGVSVGGAPNVDIGTFFKPSGTFYNAGLDFTDCVGVNVGGGLPPVIRMKQGHYISFDETNLITVREVTGLIQWRNGNQEIYRLDGHGDTEQLGRAKMTYLNIPDKAAPSSVGDPTGVIGDVIFNGPYMYRKTTSGWLRFTGSLSW